VAHAQQTDRVRRVGILQNFSDNDPVASALVAAFLAALRQSGWIAENNVRIDIRWAGTRSNDIRRHAAVLQPGFETSGWAYSGSQL
jgi:putative ABC transport system substrate-binding protein